MPEYELLRSLATLNVIRVKNRPAEAERALNLYLHVARLSASTSTLVGQMIAASMYRAVAGLAQSTKVKTDYSHFTAVGEAYRRVSWGWAYVVRAETFTGEASLRWRPYLKYKLGFCAGVTENAVLVEGFGDFLYPAILFERDLSEDLDRSKAFIASLMKICDLTELNSLQRRSPAAAVPALWGRERLQLWSSTRVELPLLPNPARLPFVRRIFAYYMLKVATPSYITGAYRDRIGSK